MTKEDLEKAKAIIEGLGGNPTDEEAGEAVARLKEIMGDLSEFDSIVATVDLCVEMGQKAWLDATETIHVDVRVPKGIRDYFFEVAKSPLARKPTKRGVSLHWEFRTEVFAHIIMRGLHARAMEMKAEEAET